MDKKLYVQSDSRGAMGAIHGAGENLRGNVIGALDTLFGGKNEEEAHRVAQRGQEEMHSGVQRMRGRSKDARGTAAAEGQPQPQVQEPAQQAASQEQPTGPAQPAQPQGQTRGSQPQPEVEESEQQAQPVSGRERSVRDEQKIPATSS